MAEFRFQRDQHGNLRPCFGQGMPDALAPYGAMHDIVDHAVHGFAFDAEGEALAMGARLWRECGEEPSLAVALERAWFVGQDTRRTYDNAGNPWVPPLSIDDGHMVHMSELRAVIGAAAGAACHSLRWVENTTRQAERGFCLAMNHWGTRAGVWPRRLHDAFQEAVDALRRLPPGEYPVVVRYDDALPGCRIAFDVTAERLTFDATQEPSCAST